MMKINKLFFASALSLTLIQPTLAAYNDPGTDYSAQLALASARTPWVNHPSNSAVGLADVMACILSDSGVGLPGYANKTWVAYVNEQKCDLTDQSDTTTYAKMTITSSMASTSSTQDIVAWAEFSDKARFVVNAQVSASESDQGPWGLWSFRFKQVGLIGGNDAPDITDADPYAAERGYASTVLLDSGDVELRSGARFPEGGTSYESMAAKVLSSQGSSDNIQYVSFNHDEWSGSVRETYDTGKSNINDVYASEIDTNGLVSNTQECRSRSNVWETNWRHALFDANTGELFELPNPGFEFAATDNTSIYSYGNVGMWGVWLSGEPRDSWTLDPAEQIVAIQQEYGERSAFSLTLAHGKLIKTGRTRVSPNVDHKLRTWGQNGELNVKWDRSNRKFVAYDTSNAQDVTDTAQLNTDIAAQLQNGSSQLWRWFWNENLRKSLHLEVSSASDAIAFQANASHKVVFQEDVWDRVDGSSSTEDALLYPSSTANSAHFVCVDNCLAPIANTIDYPISAAQSNALVSSTGDWRSIPQKSATKTDKTTFEHYYLASATSTSFLPGTLYRDKTGDGLTSDDEPVIFNFYETWGDEDHTLKSYDSAADVTRTNNNDYMSMRLHLVTSSCSVDDIESEQQCKTDNQYRWETGQQNWHLGTIIRDADGDSYAVSEPLMLKVTYDSDKDKNALAVGNSDSNFTGQGSDPTGAGTLAYVLPNGYWDEFSASNCNSNAATWDNTLQGCKYVFELEQYDGKVLTTEYDGRELRSPGVRDLLLGDWIRLMNPKDGELIFTDVNDATKTYRTVAVEREENLLLSQNTTCGVASSGDSSVEFTGVMDQFGLTDIPGIVDNTNYPLPTNTWAEKPSPSLDCVVRESVEVGNCSS